MDLLFFWGIKLWGMGAFKTLFYVFLIMCIIHRIIATISAFASMTEEDSTGMFWAKTGFNALSIFLGEDFYVDYKYEVNYVNPISSLLLLIGYSAMIFIFPNYGYPINTIFWTSCILHSCVAVFSIIGCCIGQRSLNGIVFAIMDIIAIINLNSILV